MSNPPLAYDTVVNSFGNQIFCGTRAAVIRRIQLMRPESYVHFTVRLSSGEYMGTVEYLRMYNTTQKELQLMLEAVYRLLGAVDAAEYAMTATAKVEHHEQAFQHVRESARNLRAVLENMGHGVYRP